MSENADLRRMDAYQSNGMHAEAARIAEQAVATGTASLALHLRLVTLLLKLGRYRDAGQITRLAVRCRVDAPMNLVELGKRLLVFQFSRELVELAGRLLAKPMLDAPMEAELAILVSMTGEQEVAGKLLGRAMARLGPTPALLYNRSQLRMYSGKTAEAEQDLRHCLQLEPWSGKTCWALSKLGSAVLDDEGVKSLAMLARGHSPGSANEVFANFALFNFHDRADRRELAWEALERGCRLKRATLAYDGNNTRRLFDALCTGELPDRDAPGADVDVGGVTPIFIVGMHRSGTTLLERILGNHSSVTEAGELYDFPAQLRWMAGRHFNGPSDISVLSAIDGNSLREVGSRYLEGTRWRAKGHRFLVDKLPSNFLNVGYIQRALPGAKVVHLHRNGMDTCFSNLKELFSNACAYSYDQDELAGYFRQYRRLMRHWHETIPGFVLDVSYEALTADPGAQTRRILDFCGLAWEPGCLDVGANTRTVNTASSSQVREPIHRRNVEAWKRYADQLEPLRRQLTESGDLD